MKQSTQKRRSPFASLTAALLCVLLLCALVPVTALAEGTEPPSVSTQGLEDGTGAAPVASGGTEGNAAAYAAKLCGETGLTYRGLASVQMPENYIALSAAPSESECAAMIARAKPVLSGLARQIERGGPFTKTPVSLGGRFISGPFNPLYYRF